MVFNFRSPIDLHFKSALHSDIVHISTLDFDFNRNVHKEIATIARNITFETSNQRTLQKPWCTSRL